MSTMYNMLYYNGPTLSDSNSGAEPPLYDIIAQYYVSSGIPSELAAKYASEYIKHLCIASTVR